MRSKWTQERFEQAVSNGREDFSKEDLSGLDLSGRYLQTFVFSGADLSGTDLSGTDLSNTDLSQANLTGANLTGAVLIWAELGNSVFPGRVRSIRAAARATAKYLQQCGWLQNHWVDGTYGCCPACLHGAVVLAGGPMGPSLGNKLERAGYDTCWNDEDDRTLEEVLAPLRVIARGKELAPAFMS